MEINCCNRFIKRKGSTPPPLSHWTAQKPYYIHLDSTEELEVENGQDDKRDESHSDEVGDEDVIAGVRQT